MSNAIRYEFNDLLARVGEARAMYELGVHRTTIYRWLKGKVEIPKSVMYVMRDLAYGVGVDPDWENWKFYKGHLVSPTREQFTPGDLLAIRYMRGQIDALNRANKELEGKVKALSVDAAVRAGAANDAAIDFIPAEQPPRIAYAQDQATRGRRPSPTSPTLEPRPANRRR